MPVLNDLNDNKSIVLLSGGLDSAANLAIGSECSTIEFALTVDYGQKAAAREISASRKLCEYYGVRHRIMKFCWLGELAGEFGGSALTSIERDVPKLTTSDLDEAELTRATAKAVWVPNRNGVLINAAAAFAESLCVPSVVVGFNKEEAATFPDNSQDYLVAVNRSLFFSTSNGVRVLSYTASLDKREIVRSLRALKKRFPFEKLWSCNHGGELPCGQCESSERMSRAVTEGPGK